MLHYSQKFVNFAVKDSGIKVSVKDFLEEAVKNLRL